MSYHVPGLMCVGVTVWFGWGDVVSLCRLGHYCFVRVECGGWGLMAVWDDGLVSPGFCSRISLPSWWRVWI
jgi:hypothetical protein